MQRIEKVVRGSWCKQVKRRILSEREAGGSIAVRRMCAVSVRFFTERGFLLISIDIGDWTYTIRREPRNMTKGCENGRRRQENARTTHKGRQLQSFLVLLVKIKESRAVKGPANHTTKSMCALHPA